MHTWSLARERARESKRGGRVGGGGIEREKERVGGRGERVREGERG